MKLKISNEDLMKWLPGAEQCPDFTDQEIIDEKSQTNDGDMTEETMAPVLELAITGLILIQILVISLSGSYFRIGLMRIFIVI